MKSQYEVILGDTKNVLKEMIEKGERVDMIFTSPPYYSMRKNYSGNNDGEVGSIHVDEYADWFLEFTELFLKVLKPNGSFFLNINDKIDAEAQLGAAMSAFQIQVEAYPDLKANSNFMQLQNEISDIENKLAAVRRFFNSATRELNYAIESIPSNIVAGFKNMKPQPMFDLGAGQRETMDKAPEIKF